VKRPEQLGLSREEWGVILDANNGHLRHTDEQGQPIWDAKNELWPNIVDHIVENNADKHHGCDGNLLIAKLHLKSAEDWDVIMAVVEGFWELSEDCTKSRIPGSE
jgi:hypothetical protein